MGKAEDEEERRKRETFQVRTKGGREYNLPVEVEEGSMAHALEKFKTGYDQVEVDEARKRAKASRRR